MASWARGPSPARAREREREFINSARPCRRNITNKQNNNNNIATTSSHSLSSPIQKVYLGMDRRRYAASAAGQRRKKTKKKNCWNFFGAANLSIYFFYFFFCSNPRVQKSSLDLVLPTFSFAAITTGCGAAVFGPATADLNNRRIRAWWRNTPNWQSQRGRRRRRAIEFLLLLLII